MCACVYVREKEGEHAHHFTKALGIKEDKEQSFKICREA